MQYNEMLKKREYPISNLVPWLTGILVSLSVGFSMTNTFKGGLTLPWWAGGATLALIVGWVVVITTVIITILAILEK